MTATSAQVKQRALDPGEIDALAGRLATEGFVHLPGLCAPSFIEQIRNVARARIDEVRSALGNREIGIGSAAGYDEIVQRSPGRWDLPIPPRRFGTRDREMPWWPLIEAVLGPGAEHSFSGVVYSEPGSPAQCWHIDSPHEAADHRPAHAMNVLVALQDIPADMGPTEFARGSQSMTNHLQNPLLLRDELIYQHVGTSPDSLVDGTSVRAPDTWSGSLNSGSCLAFDDRILHRGLANQSGRNRYVAYFSYRKNGYVGDTHFESARSVFDKG